MARCGASRAASAALLLVAAVTILAATPVSAVAKKQLVIDQSAFPEVRPPMWQFRTSTQSKGWGCNLDPDGTLHMRISHLPFPNTTADDMLWFYHNLAGSSRHPGDGQVYPNYLLLHPRDHVKMVIMDKEGRPALGAKAGSTLRGAEFPLTGCQAQPFGAKSPFVCPSGAATHNPGFLKSTPLSEWREADQGNGTTYVRSLTKSSTEMVAKKCADGACSWTVRTRHTWHETPEGVQMLTAMDIGMMPDLDNEGKKKAARPTPNDNHAVLEGWANGDDPMNKCKKIASHLIEELGTIPLWVPHAARQEQQERQQQQQKQKPAAAKQHRKMTLL